MAVRALPVSRSTFLYWAAVCAVAAFVLARPIPVSVPPELAAEPGLQLLYPELGRGLSSWSMPGPSLVAALVQEGGAAAVALPLAVLLCVLLAFSLGHELESLPAGVVSAALAAGLLSRESPLDLEQLLLADGVLLVGALLAAPSKRPRWKDLAVGAAIAASLLVRGVLAPFPLIAALCGFSHRRSFAAALRRFALLSAVPLLVMLVWGAVQRSANGRFVFLEWSGARADSNLITGALGLTGTVEGDAYGLAGVSPRGGVLLWAAGEIARHPVRFARAFAGRVRRVVAQAPFLFLFALVGAWRCARREDLAPVAALGAYFLLFHCLMSVEERYFFPLRLLACPLAASCLGLIPGTRAGAAHSAAVAWLCFVPAAAATAGVTGLLLRFPWAERPEAGLDRALEKSPNNPALLLLRGQRELKHGRATTAQVDFDASYRLSGRDEARFGALLAAFTRGPRDPALETFLPEPEERSPRVAMLKAFVRLEQGRDAEARAALARARELWISEKAYVRGAAGAHEELHQANLRDNDTMMINVGFNTIFFSLPKARRLALAGRLPRLRVEPLAAYDRLISRYPNNAGYRHDRGVVSVLLGRWPQAVADLRAAIALDPAFHDAYRSLAAACVENGDHGGASAAYRALLARPGLPAYQRAELEREISSLETAAKPAPAPKTR